MATFGIVGKLAAQIVHGYAVPFLALGSKVDLVTEGERPPTKLASQMRRERTEAAGAGISILARSCAQSLLLRTMFAEFAPLSEG